jgi:hypothetical protein
MTLGAILNAGAARRKQTRRRRRASAMKEYFIFHQILKYLSMCECW